MSTTFSLKISTLLNVRNSFSKLYPYASTKCLETCSVTTCNVVAAKSKPLKFPPDDC